MKASRTLVSALSQYTWPGNIRPLENMMKRFVVLQDEGLILSELVRLEEEEASYQASTVKAPVPVQVVAVPSSAPLVPAASETSAGPADPEGDDAAHAAGDEGGIQLATLARTAAMQAEREAIEMALARFRWNRRKAAAYLNVSYKTLLNKMKECGISDPGAS